MLPPDLTARRAEQGECRRELADAEAALRLLEGEERAAEKAAEAAQAELAAAIEVVLRQELDRAAEGLRRAEQAVAVRRLELAAFVNGMDINAAYWPALSLVRDAGHSLLTRAAPEGTAEGAAGSGSASAASWRSMPMPSSRAGAMGSPVPAPGPSPAPRPRHCCRRHRHYDHNCPRADQ